MTREQLEKYIEDTYSVSGEHPFEKSPGTTVFRHANNKKWFAIIMNVKKSNLGIKEEGDIDNVNTKCDFILINSMLSEKGFYPAYHMNKTHWITTLLDGSVDSDRICGLVDISYELTRVKGGKKNAKEKQ